MKKTKITAIILCFIFVLSVAASAAVIAPVSGQNSHTEQTLYNGVTYAKITTPSGTAVYDKQTFNVVQFDLAQRDLYLENAFYNNNVIRNLNASVKNLVTNYNANNPGKTAIAAVNGDIWLLKNQTQNNIKDNGDGFVFSATRGFNMVNGEIYTTIMMSQEALASEPWNDPAQDPFWAFGVTDDFVPVVGQPFAFVTMKDVTRNKTIGLDGINRTPANNAIVMYTDRLMSDFNDFAPDDAYELLIEFDQDYTMCHGANVTGTLKAIYKPTDSTNPPKINNKQMVITARGDKITNDLKAFQVGDKINFIVGIYDMHGKNGLWQKVQNSIGAQHVYAVDGQLTNVGIHEDVYPSTFVGYNRAGKIFLITMDGRNYGGVGGSQERYNKLIKDLDLYELALLDGGSSMTMVTMKSDGSYAAVSTYPGAGSYRVVNNALVLSHGPQRAAQGEIEINNAVIEDVTNVTFPTKGHVLSFMSAPNEASYSWEEGCLKLTAETASDPFITLNYDSAPAYASANTYKYITLVYEIPKTNASANYTTEIFCNCNGNGAAAGQSVAVQTKRSGRFEYATFDAGALSEWKGNITSLRLDFFSGGDAINAGSDYMLIHNVMLAKTATEAAALGKAEADKLNNSTIRITDVTNVTFPTEEHVTAFMEQPNEATLSFEDECLKMTVSGLSEGKDPYATLNYESADDYASADVYKYVTVVYKIPSSASAKNYHMELYCNCNGNGPAFGQSVVVETSRTNRFEVATFDAGSLSEWNGYVTSLRIDCFTSDDSIKNGDSVYIHNVILSKTSAEGASLGKTIASSLNPAGLKGDCNNDGKVNNKDVVTLFRYVSNAGAYELLYDYNDDGKLNNKDVVALFRAISK